LLTVVDRGRVVTRVQRDRLDMTLDLSDVPPGPYTLRAGVSDGTHTADRAVGVVVK
jgi:hypothetical protein